MNGNFPDRFAGKALPLRRGLERLVRSTSKEQFAESSLVKEAGRPSFKLVRHSGTVIVVVVDTYLEYKDIRRFSRGDIQADYLVGKSGIRGTDLYLIYYALTSPEPISKIASAAAAVILLAADVSSDVIQGRREAAALVVLQEIDREEQYHAARRQIVALLKGPGEY